MGGGMDQYLANELTRGHILQVVADPKIANAVMTDRIGPMFEARMDDLFPPEEPVKEAKKKEEKGEGEPDENALMADAVNKAAPVGAMAVSGRGRGTVFLVDIKTREVLWSTFDRTEDRTGREMDRTAARIVATLKKDMGLKK